MDTLVLNSDGAPLSVLPLSAVRWQEAIQRVWLDKVTVLDWYDDWVVSSPSWETQVPAVIMLRDYVRKQNKPNFSKFNITLRDRFMCQYCETKVTRADVTMDHVIPVSRGGLTAWDNIVAACYACNHKKSDKLMKPIRAPYAPSYYELVAIHKTLPRPYTVKHPSWESYL